MSALALPTRSRDVRRIEDCRKIRSPNPEGRKRQAVSSLPIKLCSAKLGCQYRGILLTRPCARRNASRNSFVTPASSLADVLAAGPISAARKAQTISSAIEHARSPELLDGR